MRRRHALTTLLAAIILLNACAFDAGPAVPNSAPEATSTAAPVAATSAPGTPESPTSSAGRVTITFGEFEDWRPVYAPLIAAFEKDNPEIHVQFVPLDPIFRTGEPPDRERAIMSAADTTGEPMNAEAVAKGYVRDLRPLIDADASFDRADFYPGVLESVTQDRGIYMVPRTFRLPLLFYNKDLWARHDLPAPKPDWTWPDLLAASQQLAQKRGESVETYGVLDWFAGVAMFGELDTAGIHRDPSQQMRIDDPKVVAAVEQVADLIKSGAILSASAPNLPHNGELPDEKAIGDLIRDQRIGIWGPDLCCYDLGTTPLPFEVGVVPFPAPGFSYFSSVEGYAMSSGAQQPEAAWRWLSFLSQQDVVSPHQSQWEPTFAATMVPARPSVAERSGYWQKADPQLAAALKAALDSPAARRMSGLTPPPIFDNFGFDEVLMQVTRGEKTAGAALAEAQRAREQRLAQQPPTPPTPAPIVVATPIPEAAASAATITFGAPSFAVDQAQRLAASFNAANPDVFVAVKDISPAIAGQINSDTRIRPLAEVAATTDCFSFFGPLDPAAITATLDLQPLIDADPGFPSDDYPAALLAPFRQGTGLHALPDAVYFRVLHYNQAAFDAAGLAQPTAAWTLDDFLAAAQRLTSGAGKDRQYGFGSFGGQTREVFFFLDRLGAAETTGSGAAQQPNFTDPRVVQAVRAYLDLLRAASPHTHLQGYRRDDLRDEAYGLITAGRVAMWFDLGLGLPGDMNAQSGFAHAIAPPPLGSSPITANDFFVRGLAISAQSQRREACWNWLKYVSGDVSSLRGGFPARRSLAESDAFTRQATPGAAAVYQAYRTAVERTLSVGGALADRGQSPVDYYWFFRALDRALQGANLERELAQAQDLTGQYLTCVQGGAPGGTCATRVDPDYQGRKNAASITATSSMASASPTPLRRAA